MQPRARRLRQYSPHLRRTRQPRYRAPVLPSRGIPATPQRTSSSTWARRGADSSNLYNSGNVTATTETVSDLLTNGSTVYARLYWLINGVWQHADYTYLAF